MNHYRVSSTQCYILKRIPRTLLLSMHHNASFFQAKEKSNERCLTTLSCGVRVQPNEDRLHLTMFSIAKPLMLQPQDKNAQKLIVYKSQPHMHLSFAIMDYILLIGLRQDCLLCYKIARKSGFELTCSDSKKNLLRK